ncbi:Unknown protein sequence [Pseudomonas syringae pv. syringae]|nr:Unknown protein sequence [Pseudomonas syringae pv. syringae]
MLRVDQAENQHQKPAHAGFFTPMGNKIVESSLALCRKAQ